MTSSISTVQDLRQQPTWDPGKLIAAGFKWPFMWDQRELQQTGEKLEARVFAELGTQVITPIGLDRVNGGVRKRTTTYRGAAYLVGGDPQNLQPGDLLVPTGSEQPALFVDDHLLGASVSGGFVAYRFPTKADAYWAWAIINSTSGKGFRRAHLTRSLASERSTIDTAPIPWPNETIRATAATSISEIEKQTRRAEEVGVETWWATADLRGVAWRIALATPNSNALTEGVPLEDLANEIRAGRSFDRKRALTSAQEGAYPVVTGSVLADRPTKWWLVDPPISTLTEPGDLLVAVVGMHANARVCTSHAVVDSGVYRIRLEDQRQAKPIAAYLNSQQGYGLRKMFVSDRVIPRVGRQQIGAIRIPESLQDGSETAGPVEPLSERLERVLWEI
jgi:hypothetical protein